MYRETWIFSRMSVEFEAQRGVGMVKYRDFGDLNKYDFPPFRIRLFLLDEFRKEGLHSK